MKYKAFTVAVCIIALMCGKTAAAESDSGSDQLDVPVPAQSPSEGAQPLH